MTTVWFEVARAAVAVNVALLGGLAFVWVRNYRSHGARHTLGLLVFAAVLLAQNLLALYLYTLHPEFHDWMYHSGSVAHQGTMAVNVLETVALSFLAWITWR